MDFRKADAITAQLNRPIAILPTEVGEPILPFAIGASEISALMKPDGSATSLRCAFGADLHSKRYYFAAAQPDSFRHDLDGRAHEEVSNGDRLAAQRSFQNLKQKDVSSQEPTVAVPPVQQLTKAELIRASLLKRKRL